MTRTSRLGISLGYGAMLAATVALFLWIRTIGERLGGAAILREIIPAVERAQVRMLEPLKPTERKALIGLLVQLVDLNNEASRVPLRAEDALEHLGKTG